MCYIKKMQRILITILIFLFFSPVAYGLTLEGGVSYTVESARKEAFDGVKYKIPVSSFKEHLKDPNFAENKAALAAGVQDLGDRKICLFSDGTYGVFYINNMYNVYFYDKYGRLDSMDIRSSLTFPVKTYKYTPKGILENVVFDISLKETFIYKLNGELEGHWVDDNCYDEKGNLVLRRF